MKSILALTLALGLGCGAEDPDTAAPETPSEPEETRTASPDPDPEPAAERPRSREHGMPEAPTLGTLPEGIGVAVGAPAPDVTVRDFDGDERSLASLWAEGAVLLVFYRGGWCPYCNFQVHALTEAYPEFQERGITPAVISVDVSEEGTRTRASWEIPFPVLSDSGLDAHRAYHVVNEVDDATVERLRGMGMDLEAHSGGDHHTVAVPAIFLIDREGVVRWAHADHDYRTRPSVEQILGAIPALAP